MKGKNKVFLAFGSNVGDKEANIALAVKKVRSLGAVEKVSILITTAPVGYSAQEDFFNGALILHTDLSPLNLLKKLKEIEAEVGRTPTFKNGPRVIDLDIVFYNDLILKTENLTIPHPRAHERKFVLEPLTFLEGDFVHPKLRKTVSILLQELK